MAAMRKKKQDQEHEDKVLDVNASMQGTLRFEDPVNLRINGKFVSLPVVRSVWFSFNAPDLVN